MRYAARSIGRGIAAGDNATTDRTVLTVTRQSVPVETHGPHPARYGVTRPATDGLRAAAPPKSGTGRFR
jgi:hypothetical protein